MFSAPRLGYFLCSIVLQNVIIVVMLTTDKDFVNVENKSAKIHPLTRWDASRRLQQGFPPGVLSVFAASNLPSTIASNTRPAAEKHPHSVMGTPPHLMSGVVFFNWWLVFAKQREQHSERVSALSKLAICHNGMLSADYLCSLWTVECTASPISAVRASVGLLMAFFTSCWIIIQYLSRPYICLDE